MKTFVMVVVLLAVPGCGTIVYQGDVQTGTQY
jgi:hypothetical protein